MNLSTKQFGQSFEKIGARGIPGKKSKIDRLLKRVFDWIAAI
jgi:hypothetical protein